MPLEVWLLVGEKWERVPEGRDLGGNDGRLDCLDYRGRGEGVWWLQQRIQVHPCLQCHPMISRREGSTRVVAPSGQDTEALRGEAFTSGRTSGLRCAVQPSSKTGGCLCLPRIPSLGELSLGAEQCMCGSRGGGPWKAGTLLEL